jgi:hypothetical protein
MSIEDSYDIFPVYLLVFICCVLTIVSQIDLRRQRHDSVVVESGRYVALGKVAGEISGISRLLAQISGDKSIDVSADGLAAVVKYSLTETQAGPNRIAEASDLMKKLCYNRVALGLNEKLRNVLGLALALRSSSSGATDEEARVFAAVNLDSMTIPPLSELTRGLRRSDAALSPRRGAGSDSPRIGRRWDSPTRGESPTRAGR